MKKNKIAFTIVELVVSATILVILTSIGFYSYTQNISDGRDARRKTDIAMLGSALNLYKKNRGSYPVPGNSITLQNVTTPVALQGFMNTNVPLSTAKDIPYDPEMDIPYFYSTTNNKKEYQLAASLENNESPISLVDGDYKSVAKNLLPTIVLATNTTSSVNITSPSNLFIFHNGYHTLPYDFEDGLAYSDGTSLATLISDAGKDFWQNSDYRSCVEIYEAGKGLSYSGVTNQYQILNNSGSLVDVNCKCYNTGCTQV